MGKWNQPTVYRSRRKLPTCPRPGKREVVTDAWRSAVVDWMRTNDVSDVELGRAVHASKQAIGLLLNPRPAGRKAIGTSTLFLLNGRVCVKHRRVRVVLEKWAETGAELLRADPDAYREVLAALRARLNRERPRSVTKIDRR